MDGRWGLKESGNLQIWMDYGVWKTVAVSLMDHGVWKMVGAPNLNGLCGLEVSGNSESDGLGDLEERGNSESGWTVVFGRLWELQVWMVCGV